MFIVVRFWKRATVLIACLTITLILTQPSYAGTIVIDGDAADWFAADSSADCLTDYTHLATIDDALEFDEPIYFSRANALCSAIDTNILYVLMGWQVPVRALFADRNIDTIDGVDDHCLYFNTDPEADDNANYALCYEATGRRASGIAPRHRAASKPPSLSAQMCDDSAVLSCPAPTTLDPTALWQGVIWYEAFAPDPAFVFGEDADQGGVELSLPLSQLGNPTTICLQAVSQSETVFPADPTCIMSGEEIPTAVEMATTRTEIASLPAIIMLILVILATVTLGVLQGRAMARSYIY